MNTDSARVHALSFDVEEHFQVAAFWSEERRRGWDHCESRVEQNVNKILALLSVHGIHATFFLLGWVALKHQSLVTAIARHGHEIASHGFGHEMITTQQPRQFREDVRKSKGILEDIIGKPVHGYRAPSFTITPKTQWALPILVEEGYLYDSSIFPVQHDRYGMPGANPRCHRIETASGPLWEVPPSTVLMGPVRLPIAGGGYFRLYPYPVLRRLLTRAAADGHPLIMYLHPWELDPDQPRMEGSLVSRFRHYLNLRKTEARLHRLVTDFRFTSIREAVEPVGAACASREGLLEPVVGGTER
ncbi:XrtA system polysaccharide deacetylase [Nitrospira sp. NS4]|uniref:XrtA system polysaccharide deacetylase n=1 Tax=Nitrospira sp. NS4 TaxID=3414498 RepID=UPI003C2B52CF